MNLMIKLVFFGVIASLFVSYYGDEMVRGFDNQIKLTRDAVPEELDIVANLVHSQEIPRHNDGHYWVNMHINDADIDFIVDTGASMVTLSYEDAKRLTMPYFENQYDVPVLTAGGQTTMALVTLDVIKIGAIELYDVPAYVAQQGTLSVSLLGMNFLNRLDRFEFRDQQLVLEQ